MSTFRSSKTYFAGTERIVSPETTLSIVQPLLPSFGITRVADVTGLDRVGIPVVQAIRPNARSLSVSQGKGATKAAAQVSAIMEAIELAHAETIQAPLLRGSAEELAAAGRRLVDHSRLSLSSHPTAQQPLWIEGRYAANGDAVWVPFDCVQATATYPSDRTTQYVVSSNGLASGNCFAEAACHAIYELIERDAMAQWRLALERNRYASRVALASIEDAWCREMLSRFHVAGVDVAVFHATSQFGIPVYACYTRDHTISTTNAGIVANGMGCHPNPAVALSRAISEAAQGRLTFIAASRDDMTREQYRRMRSATNARASKAFFEGEGQRGFASDEGWSNPTLDEDLDAVLKRLRQRGVSDIVLVDLTKPGFPLAVVRAVAPGLTPPNVRSKAWAGRSTISRAEGWP